MNEKNPNAVSTLNLAFLGDGVFDLLVRTHLVDEGRTEKVKTLNRKKVNFVNCSSQADFIKELLPLLSEEELEVFKRGRNAHPHSSSKHGTVSDYHAATGLETLFGWLYLKEEKNRILFLFSQILRFVDDAAENDASQA